MLATLLQFILYICRFHYGLILAKFSDYHVGMVFHKIIISVKEFNLNNNQKFIVSLSNNTNEYFQEIIRIYVPFRQLKYAILQLRYI